VKEERNIVHTIKRRKANWIGHILRRNCLLKHVTEGYAKAPHYHFTRTSVLLAAHRL
jgi:hypothetical protein